MNRRLGLREAVTRPAPDRGDRAGVVDERQRLWAEILDRLPSGWRIASPPFDAGRDRWEAVAIGPKLGGRARAGARLYHRPGADGVGRAARLGGAAGGDGLTPDRRRLADERVHPVPRTTSGTAGRTWP